MSGTNDPGEAPWPSHPATDEEVASELRQALSAEPDAQTGVRVELAAARLLDQVLARCLTARPDGQPPRAAQP